MQLVFPLLLPPAKPAVTGIRRQHQFVDTTLQQNCRKPDTLKRPWLLFQPATQRMMQTGPCQQPQSRYLQPVRVITRCC